MRNVFIAFIMVLVLGLSQVFAQEETPRGGMKWTEKRQDSTLVYEVKENVLRHGARGMRMHFLPGTDLTQEQQEKIKTIRMGSAQDLLVMKGKVEVLSAELKNLLIVENPDRKAIYKKIEEISAVKTEIQKKHTDVDLEIQKMFTPEQRLKWKQRIFSGRKGFGEMKTPMPGKCNGACSECSGMEMKVRKLVRPVPGSDEKELEVIIEKK